SSPSFTAELKDFIAPIPVNLANCGTVRGSKFKDVNGNGTKDSGETGLGGFTFQLMSGGSVVSSTTSAGDGSFSFANVPVGSYTVHEVGQTGWLQTAPASGDR